MNQPEQPLPQIFEEIRILDFTQVISGSYATTMLADMGAEVIKVEPPQLGDTLRMAGPMYNRESGFFMLNNRNKQSISINLKDPLGLQIIKDLVTKVDVVTENFSPGVMAKLGLGYEQLRKLKPELIYLSVSGYGQNNRYSSRQAYDNIVQAFSGLTSLNGLPENDTPLRSPFSVSDYVAGIYSAFALSTALFHREKTGEGQYLDVAMYDSLISIMDNSFLIYDIQKRLNQTGIGLDAMGLKNTGNRHAGAAPHGYFKTKDGYIAHMSLSNHMWNTLLTVIDRPELIDHPDYNQLDLRKKNWKEIDRMIENWTSLHTTKEVFDIFTENRLPCGPARSIDEVYNDEHNNERGIFHEIEHPIAGPIKITNLPIKYSRTPAKITTPSPMLGEHTEKILKKLLNYSDEQIETLYEKNVLYNKCNDLKKEGVLA